MRRTRTLGSRVDDSSFSREIGELKKIPSPLSRLRRKKSVEGTLFKEHESHHSLVTGRGLRPEKLLNEDLLRDNSELQFDMDTQEPLVEREESDDGGQVLEVGKAKEKEKKWKSKMYPKANDQSGQPLC